MIQPITQTVEEEEYPSQGNDKGSREQWDRGADPDGEWTSEGNGESAFQVAIDGFPHPLSERRVCWYAEESPPLWEN